MNTRPLVIANWKMQFSFSQSLQFCASHKQWLAAKAEMVNIVVCPSFPALHPIAQIFKNSPVSLGAQNCATQHDGPFTGEVSAPMLAQVGTHYCIVGHSERRQLFGETNADVAHKVDQLLQASITPIICIGETQQQYQDKNTLSVLEQQLDSVRAVLSRYPNSSLCIAYEPIWAIGTGLSADTQYLHTVISWIKEYCVAAKLPAEIVYGGSVQPSNIASIAEIPHIGGVLVGSASLDFQKFEKIVSWFHTH